MSSNTVVFAIALGHGIKTASDHSPAAALD